MTPDELERRSAPYCPDSFAQTYTDRGVEQAVFEKVLNTPEGSLRPVVHFYGSPGTGKSWLLRKLATTAVEAGIPSVVIDFRGLPSGVEAAIRAVARLRGQLPAFDLPHFDLTFAWYCRQRGYRRGHPLRTHAWPVDAVAEYFATATEPGSIEQLRSGLPETAVERFLATPEGSRGLEQLLRSSPDAVRASLVKVFHQDLRAARRPEPDACRPLTALFVDAFDLPGDDPERERERWLRDFHDPHGRVLVVMAGVEPLRWDFEIPNKDAPIPSSPVEQCQVRGYSRATAIEYLMKRDVTDERIQDAVLGFARNAEAAAESADPDFLPHRLGLCTDLVLAREQNGKPASLADFDVPRGSLDRLTQRLLWAAPSAKHEEWVRTLAVPPRFDADVARRLFTDHRVTAFDVAWLLLLRYTFVRPRSGYPGWYEFDPTIRAAILRTDPDLEPKHARLREHWRGRSRSDTDGFAGLAWYHHLHLQPPAAVDWWDHLCRVTKMKLDAAGHDAVLSWWGPTGLFRGGELTLEEARLLAGFACGTLGDVPHGFRTANLRAAIARHRAALTQISLEASTHEWARAQINLGLAYRNLSSGDRVENWRNAVACFKAAHKVSKRTGDQHLWARTLSHLGDCYREMPDGDRATNLECALESYKPAFWELSRHAHPQEWATLLFHFGLALEEYAEFADREANLRQAEEQYRNAAGALASMQMTECLTRVQEAAARVAVKLCSQPIEPVPAQSEAATCLQTTTEENDIPT